MGKSLAQIVAELPDDERQSVLDGLDMETLVWDWSFWSRPEQRPPDDDSWNVWLYLAGRGCISGETRIYNPCSGEHIQAKNLVGIPTWVQTPYGPVYVREGTYIKGIDRLWKVRLSNGQEVLVTLGHRFLTPQGWQPLSAMRVGQTLAANAPAPLQTTLSYSSKSHANAQHYLQKDASSQFYYQTCQNLYDPQLLQEEEIFQDAFPSQVYADVRNLISSYTDVLGSGQECNHLDQRNTHHSRNSYALCEPSLEGEECFSTSLLVEQTPRLSHTSQQFLKSYAQSRQDFPRVLTHNLCKNEVCSLSTPSSSFLEEECLHLRVDSLPSSRLNSGLEQYQEESNRFHTFLQHDQDSKVLHCLVSSDDDEEWTQELQQEQISVEEAFLHHIDSEQSLDHIFSGSFDSDLQWVQIESIEFSRLDVFYDITVPHFACYYAEGMLHHNSGKTRSAAEWIRHKAQDTSQGQLRFLLVARTAADVRDVLVEGDSGVLAITPPSERPLYEPSKRRLTWPNGHTAVLSTADEPDSLRGVQAHYAWADELAAWRQTPDAAGMTSWDNLRVATRLGRNPQIVATTTPKRVKSLFDLIDEEKKTGKIYISKGSTLDNSGNLSEAYIQAITGVYGGTRLARQELYGEMLDDVEGALWTAEMISEARHNAMPLGLPLRVIGVDPSVAENPKDECGIVVCASTGDRDLYKREAWILEDATVHGSPEMWANKVVEMARKWLCPVVAEVNQGGALVRNAINAIDPNIKVFEVHSKYGKALRAEPVVLAYEQKRIHHVGYLAELESQMEFWVPGEGKSPDRVDALVHALTALLIKPPQGFVGGKITAKSPASRRIGSGGRRSGGFRVR